MTYVVAAVERYYEEKVKLMWVSDYKIMDISWLQNV